MRLWTIALMKRITGAEQDTSVCELPDEAFSGKMSAQSKASDLLASDEPGNHEKVNIDATKENAEMSAGDVPDIAASAGPFERNGKPEQPASETPVDESSNDEITRAQQDTSAFEWPDQAVVQSDQSEETRREEEKPVVARVLDAASSERPAEVSETRRNFVESENKDDSEEPEHSIVMTAPLTNQESQLHEDSFTESAARVSGKCSERSASEIEARRGDDSKEKEEAEHETAANSFSESSVTTVSVKTEDSGKSLSEYSTRTSKQESDTAPANEANKDNNGTSSACEADVENVPNNELNETRSLDAQHTVADSNNNTPRRSRRNRKSGRGLSRIKWAIRHSTKCRRWPSGLGYQGRRS
ncbi:hypothetical protein MTO96_016419 [Rhipicephalus appendiculatus]